MRTKRLQQDGLSPKSGCPFLKIIIFIYLFLAMLCLHCRAGFFLAVTRVSYAVVAALGLLAVASPVVEQGLKAHGLQLLWPWAQ